MRLYPKSLRSIEDLEREKKRLQKEAKLLDEEDFFSFGSSKGKKDKKEYEEEEGSWLDMLPIDNPLIKMALPFIQSKLGSMIAPSSQKKEKPDTEDDRPKKNILLSIGKEVLMGYLKWKAIELSYKGIKVIVKKQKEKRATRAMQAEQ